MRKSMSGMPGGWRATLAVACAAALGLAAAAGQAQVLRVGVREAPGPLDPLRAGTLSARMVLASLCERLVEIDPQLRIVPGVAQSWEWSADGRKLTFSLRAGARFHDGAPLDAAAVKANLDRMRHAPESAAPGRLHGIAEVVAPGPLTVVLRLDEPDAALPSHLAERAGTLVSPASFGKAGAVPVCSGPYRLAERGLAGRANGAVALERDDGHWDAAAYPIRRVEFLPIPDALVAMDMLRRGELDVIERVAPANFPLLQGGGLAQLSVASGLGFQALVINLRAGAHGHPLADKRVRRALALAIDRDLVDEAVGGGALVPAGQPFPPASWAFEPRFQPQGRDIDGARALLREAGHDRVAFTLAYGEDPLLQRVFELVRGMGDQAGFDIALAPMPFAELQRRLASGDFEVAQTGWSGRADPSGNIEPFVTCGAPLNDSGYCNAHLDRLLRQARAQTDPAARKDYYDQAQAILQDDAPLIFLYYLPWPVALGAGVQGYVPYPDGLLRLRAVRLAP